MTVREALQFNAIMCQSSKTSKKEKLEYVEEVIRLLGLKSCADAVIGIPGEGRLPSFRHVIFRCPADFSIGLNIEQRKKLTVGVELAARPQLLLFLDEPSSGLDSQTSWSVIDLLEKLTNHGQAILCTIHQPSAMLFQRFNRLLFLAPEGKPVYFGDIGPNSSTVVGYFERHGAKPCPADANPAEWIMEIIGCAPGSHSDIDWPMVWLQSPEHAQVHCELDKMESRLRLEAPTKVVEHDEDYREFAAPFFVQLWECFKRVNQQYWRT